MSRVVAAGIAGLLLAGCGLAPSRPSRPVIEVLESDPALLATAFNAGFGQARVVAVLSPSCASCLAGANALQDGLLAASPQEAGVEVHLVWTRILPSDTKKQVRRRMAVFDDARVHHYWDPEQRVGREVSTQLDIRGTRAAFDVYMAFSRGAVWDEGLPEPATWAHQIPGVPEPPEGGHFVEGSHLLRFFEDVRHELVGSS